MLDIRILETDVLIVGGGGAATRAALEARKLGAEVLLAVKGSFGARGSRGAGATASAVSEFGVLATPGWTGSLTEGEKQVSHRFDVSPEQDFANIIQSGLGMTDPKLAQIIVEEAVETRTTLLSWGAALGGWGTSSHGVPIMQALESEVKKANVPILERAMIVDLLVQHGECLGAIGVDETDGETLAVKARATIIATGGDANLFMLNLNPPCTTGDGYAMGYRAGAELTNMEFKQIFLGTVYPTRNMLLRPLVPHVKLTNVKGEEFLNNYLPEGASPEECLAQRQSHNPFSTRDSLSKYVDISIIGEVKAGRGSDHNGIYLDRSDPRCPKLALPRREFWLSRGIDFNRGPVEIGLCHHSSLGGFRIDENAQTTLPHLYAAGEVAAGPHGADRMGGHMLLASQVFGARAGRHAAAYAKNQRRPEIDNKVLSAAEERIRVLRNKQGNQHPADVKKILQQLAYYDLLVVRNKKNLSRLLDSVRGIEEELPRHLCVRNAQQLVEALELQNLLLLARLKATICLKRTESRGSHYREDFPQQDDTNWLKSLIVKKIGDRPKLETLAFDPSWKHKGDAMGRDWG